MRLLLDTHILLAFIDGKPSNLSREVAILETGDHVLLASVASLWEIAIKWRLGKLPLPVLPDRLPDVLGDLGVSVLPVTPDHALTTVNPEPGTRDPFDQLLLAVCQVDNLRLATIDRALVHHRLAIKL